jgi:hypothetical protein
MKTSRASLLLTSCLTATALATPLTAQVPAASNANNNATETASKVLLRFRPQLNEVRKMRMEARQNVTQVRGPRKLTMQQNFGLDLNFRVLAVDEAGANVRCTFEAVQFERVGDEVPTVRYDSRKPPKTVPEAAEGFDAFVGGFVVLRMNPQARIVEVRETDKMIDHMLNRMKIGKSSRDLVRPFMRAAMDETAMKNIGVTLASFPGRETAIGESWPKIEPVNSDWNLQYDGTCTLDKRDNGLATIGLKSVIKPMPGKKAMPFTGEQTGHYLVEEATGWTQSTKIDQRTTLKFDAAGQPVAPNQAGFFTYLRMTITQTPRPEHNPSR